MLQCDALTFFLVDEIENSSFIYWRKICFFRTVFAANNASFEYFLTQQNFIRDFMKMKENLLYKMNKC